ncbi:MAG: MATE family efflux transporter [Bacteroidales bacterium]|nr:MATE family efflux transporter [Bacteroidales bacterium]
MTQRDEKYVLMTTAPVRRLVCSFAVPAIISMLISAVYNIADTFFIGKIDTQSTAALGVVFSYMTLIQAVAFYFGQGSGNFISRALGARKDKEAEVMASTGFYTGILAACLIALGCFVFTGPVLTAFGATPTVLPRATEYFRWILAGTPFIVGTFILNNQMRLQGNANIAVWGIMSGAVLNIILDPIFIFVLGLGIEGAGMATAIAQFAGFAVMMKLAGLQGGIPIRIRNVRANFWIQKEIAAGGLPSIFRQGLMALANIVLFQCAGLYGDEALAAFSIVGRVTHLAASITIGIGQGLQPVCGYNYGARLYDRVRSAIRFSIFLTTAYCTLTAIIGAIWARPIIRIFRAEDLEVIRIGAATLRTQCITIPLLGLIISTNVFLQVTRQTRPAMATAIARNGLFFIPALLVGSMFGLGGIIAAQPVADVLSFVLSIPLLIIYIRKLR